MFMLRTSDHQTARTICLRRRQLLQVIVVCGLLPSHSAAFTTVLDYLVLVAVIVKEKIACEISSCGQEQKARPKHRAGIHEYLWYSNCRNASGSFLSPAPGASGAHFGRKTSYFFAPSEGATS
jgi:hypothetical protein